MGTFTDNLNRAEAHRTLKEWNYEEGFYCGWKDDDATIPPIVWTPDGERLSPEPSFAITRYNPSEFSWGDDSSGSSQLALALLFHCTGGDRRRALAAHQDFKRAHVACWGDAWSRHPTELKGWLDDFERSQR